MKRFIFGAAILGLLLGPVTAQADLIDFEVGFTNLQAVGTVVTGTNSVTFGNAFIAELGDQVTAFAPGDTPALPTGGNFFASNQPIFPTAALPYFITFLNPVLDLTLDLYDFRGDGGGSIGDIATLEVFADTARIISVGMDTFTVPDPQPVEGNVVTLSILSPSSPILSASLTYGADIGTAIDNINFRSGAAPVPEPGTLLLIGTGFVGMGTMVRRRSRRDGK